MCIQTGKNAWWLVAVVSDNDVCFSLPQLVGLLLVGVAAWGKGFGIVSSIHIIGGVIAVGVFLLLIAIVGLIGAIHHHQVMLFFVSFSH